MEFNNKKSIYSQISDLICENILLGRFLEEERIISIRDMASNLEVNPNTVMRAYNFLQDVGILYNKRGIGFFISKDAKNSIITLRKSAFINKDLPEVFKESSLYGISPEELYKLYSNYIKGEEIEKK